MRTAPALVHAVLLARLWPGGDPPPPTRAGGAQAAVAPDGPAAPVAGVPDVDAVRLRVVSPSIVDATFSSRGAPAFGYRAYRSTDGRTLTLVAVDPTSRAALTSVVVYRRAEPGR